MANISESPEMLEALIREVEEQLQLLKKTLQNWNKTIRQHRKPKNYSASHTP